MQFEIYVWNVSGNFEEILNGNGIFRKIALGNGTRPPIQDPLSNMLSMDWNISFF